MLPTESTITPFASVNDADVALPPSPSDGELPTTPFPATVVMMPVLADTFRMR